MAHSEPSSRNDFEIAIICALPTEYDAACLIFDEFWDDDGDKFGKIPNDPNHYTTGRIGKYNVVLALLPQMGKAAAAGVATALRASYLNLRLALLLGVCGGVPLVNGNEIILGDVIISDLVIQYDFGRQLPDKFVPKDTTRDNLGRPSTEIRTLLYSFNTNRGLSQLEKRIAVILKEVQEKDREETRSMNLDYPGAAMDRLYEPAHRHKHHDASATCECARCNTNADPVCDDALESPCEVLGCSGDGAKLVARKRLKPKETTGSPQAPRPMVHIGAVASGDTVIKSAANRDRIAEEKNVFAFEMEGAGIWDAVPCIVVKGVCDYADSHKQKNWQKYASATAASASKAIIERYIQTDRPNNGPTAAGGTGHLATSSNVGSQGSSSAKDSSATPSVGGAVFNGPISGTNVVAGTHTSGGVSNFNF